MRKLLFLFIFLAACQVKTITPDTATFNRGKITYCSALGCREINSLYFFDQNYNVVYYDRNFEVWIGYSGYWINHIYYSGFWKEYYQFYYGKK